MHRHSEHCFGILGNACSFKVPVRAHWDDDFGLKSAIVRRHVKHLPVFPIKAKKYVQSMWTHSSQARLERVRFWSHITKVKINGAYFTALLPPNHHSKSVKTVKLSVLEMAESVRRRPNTNRFIVWDDPTSTCWKCGKALQSMTKNKCVAFRLSVSFVIPGETATTHSPKKTENSIACQSSILSE